MNNRLIDIERLSRYHDNLKNVLNTKEAAGEAAKAEAAAKKYTDEEIAKLSFDEAGAADAAAAQALQDAKDYADGKFQEKGSYEEAGAAAQALADAKDYADGKFQEKGSYEQAGAAAQAQFSFPQGVTVADDGSIYVSDTGNSAIKKIANGTVTTLLMCDNTKMDLYPITPQGIAVFGDKLYVCDNFAKKVIILNR